MAVVCLPGCSTAEREAILVEKEQNFYEFYQSELFHDVQMSGMFPDSKTFTDATPKLDLDELIQLYIDEKENPGFDLKVFVEKYFSLPETITTGFETDTTKSIKEHLKSLWPVLTRKPDQDEARSSLIPIPDEYIVPGGRFREIYYWDSYFTLEGLMVSGQEDMARNMVENFSYLIDSLGFIPNGNRAYYTGRSQPPFFSLMVNRIAEDDRDLYLKYHDHLLKEYQFWMLGQDLISDTDSVINRVVRMPDGSLLNRYWDNYDIPRPESYKEDYELVHHHDLPPSETYRHLRAGAESGWDYSSRWLRDHKNLHTIHTTDIIPVDLNALLYHLELKIAQGYNWDDQIELASFYLDKATKRRDAIDKYLWSEDSLFYFDYDFVAQNHTGVYSLAAAYPLFFQMASKKQAREIKEKLENSFLMDGGFVTTLNETGQQWDAPNGWAPLQWITVNGLYNYGYGDLGNEAVNRWLQRNGEVFKETGKMMEKYNVVNTGLAAGGGEYPNQDGFGWTNGIALAFMEILERKEQAEELIEH